MTQARIHFLRRLKAYANRKFRHCCCDSTAASGEPPECIPPVLEAVADADYEPGVTLAIAIVLTAGNGLLSWSVTGLTGDLVFDTGTRCINGTMPEAGFTATVTVENDCGTDEIEFTYSPVAPAESITFRYGNFIYADFPAAGPVFVASDFTGGNANYVNYAALAAVSRVGSFGFAAGAGVRQVLWIANSLLSGSPTFNVGGLPLSLDPGPNPPGDHVPYQSLTISGIPGTVYFTSSQNNGGITVTIG